MVYTVPALISYNCTLPKTSDRHTHSHATNLFQNLILELLPCVVNAWYIILFLSTLSYLTNSLQYMAKKSKVYIFQSTLFNLYTIIYKNISLYLKSLGPTPCTSSSYLVVLLLSHIILYLALYAILCS